MDINVTAPINQLSYGIVTLNVLKELRAAGHRACWFPIGQTEVHSEEDAECCQQCYNNSLSFSAKSPSLRIFHQFDQAVGLARAEGSKANAAIAHHDCGDAIAR